MDDSRRERTSQSVQIDRLCDQFEAVWRQGKEPKIEDYLGKVAEPDRAALEHELKGIDAEWRRRRQAAPTVEKFINSLNESGLMTAADAQAFLERFRQQVDAGKMPPNPPNFSTGARASVASRAGCVPACPHA
jgi:hypothetical protein